MNDMKSLKEIMKINGVQRLYLKSLSPNDNSKNQVYFGQGFSTINIIPVKDIVPNTNTVMPGFKARLDFAWLGDDGTPHNAPNAQLILYPQYPEVRFSGFLVGCEDAPSELMTSREGGRILFLGVAADNKVFGYAISPNSVIARELRRAEQLHVTGVFQEIQLETEVPYKKLIIDTLTTVHRKGWIDSRRLKADGSSVPCNAPQCGGYTLEAEFGITPNGLSKPDIWGWEIKQYSVSDFSKIDAGIITLMTPEPTGGYYKEKGIEQFIRKFGYPDQRGRQDRINFGGIHKNRHRTGITGLTLNLVGFNQATNKIESVTGGLALIDDYGECAAMWHYSSLLEKWNKKHARTVYVPSINRREPSLQYKYGPTIRMGLGTEFLLFLKAAAEGLIYYDPGIKMEQASSTHPSIKRRSQFRMKSKELHMLYASWESVNLV